MAVDLDIEPAGSVTGQASEPLPNLVALPSKLIRMLAATSPAHLIAVALVSGAAISRLGPPSDPDVWWHLRAGQWILAHHRLPGFDTWSAGAFGHRWVAHEWGGEVIIALFYRGFGLLGLSLFRTLGVLVLLSLLAVQAFRRTTPYRALLVTALAVFATLGGWGERPQLLSFILLVPTVSYLRRSVAEGKVPWWLIPITWLWANIHGLWFLPVGIVVLFAFGTVLDRRKDGVPLAARLVVLAAGMTVAAALTPNGPGLVLEPLQIHASAHFVSEWAAPSVQSLLGVSLFGLLACIVVGWARSRRPVAWTDILVVVAATFLGLSYLRTVAPGAVLLVPYAASALGQKHPLAVRPTRWQLNAAIAAAVGFLALGGATAAIALTPSLPPGAPVAATKVIEGLSPKPQRVLDEYAIGGWLLWWDQKDRPLIDGRIEIYDLGYLNHYFAALQMSGDWQATVARLHPAVALLTPGTPLTNGLRDELHWQVKFQDANWVVLTPPTAAVPEATP